MSRSTPSLMALLGLVAVAGYQNRDKLAGLLARENSATLPGVQPQAQGGLLGELASAFNAGSSGGGGIAGGLGELVDRFRSAGRGQAAESWVSDQPNQSLNASEVEEVIGAETVDELAQKTGLSRAEILERLATALPETVNRLTPRGRLPSEDEARELF